MNEEERKWYALYTSPRAEKRVDFKLQENGIETYLPLHRSPRVWSDRIKLVDIPLFRSYLFVCCYEEELKALPLVTGVVKIVKSFGHPAVIFQSEIDAIKEFLKFAAGKKLCLDDEVEILNGPLRHQTGMVTDIQKKIVRLVIPGINATVCVSTESVAHVKRL
jgi:transcription antitermination factor NusG